MPKRFLLPPNATARTKEIPLQEALRQYAAGYVESALLPDSSASVRFADLLSGFQNYLLNRNVILRSLVPLEAPLRDALGNPPLSQVRGRAVAGMRFRTPDDR